MSKADLKEKEEEEKINQMASVITMTKRRTLKNRKRDESKFVLSDEVAEDQLVLFMDFYEIYEDDQASQEVKDAIETTNNKVKIAIRKGLLNFKEDGTFAQTLESKHRKKIRSEKPTIIEYGILTGKAKVQNRHIKNESDDAARTRRLYSIMGSMANMSDNDMMKLSALDLSAMECVGFLLSTV